MARSIIISDVDGNNPIILQGVRVPGTYPEFVPEGNGVKFSQCRRTRVSKGARIAYGFGGLTDNHLNFPKTKFELLKGAELLQFRAWNNARPPVVLFSLDGGINRYFAIIPDDGFNLGGYRFWEDDLEAYAKENWVEMSLMILCKAERGFNL